MQPTPNQSPDSDLPHGVSQPARRAFAAIGYTRLEQFAGAREADLLKLHGVGPKSIRIIRSALAARGLAFAPPDANTTGGPSGA